MFGFLKSKKKTQSKELDKKLIESGKTIIIIIYFSQILIIFIKYRN